MHNPLVKLLDSIWPKLNLIPVQMKDRVFIGIDPGVSGGIAVIFNDDYYVRKCPSTILDMAKEIAMLSEAHIGPDIPKRAIVEKVHSFPGNSARSMFNFGTNYGQWLGILATLKIPYILVSPHKWMSHYGSRPKEKKERKNHLKALAQQRYPDADITLATSDAMLICNYLKETNKV